MSPRTSHAGFRSLANPTLRTMLSALAATPLPIATPNANGTAPNVVLLDTIVFLVGVAIFGGLTAYFARRIFFEKDDDG